MDIDKLFLSCILYKVNREEGEDGKFHQTVSDQFKESEDAYYQNKILRDYIAMLLDKKSVNLLHRSIDNDTKLLKDIIKDLEEGGSFTEEEPYGFYSLSTQTASKNDYITGKIGIGPYALNNNNHVLTMLYHVKFKHIESSIMAALDLEDLGRRIDQDKLSIMSWISALINAHVDIAKDPYISRLNINPFTYNISNLLVRTGLGKKTFYFTTQPIMKQLAEAYINAGSMYMADPYSSKYELQQEAIDLVEQDWFGDMDYTYAGHDVKSLIAAAKEGGIENKEIRELINNRIKQLFDNDIISDAKSKDVDMEHLLFYYLAYLLFDKYAKALSSLVTYSKIDTKKHGKSVIEQIVYKKGFEKTYDTTRLDSLFDEESLNHMLNDSYILTKTANAIDSVRDILSSQFIESTPAFLNDVDTILKSIGRYDSLSARLVGKVSDALSAAIKSKFFVENYVPKISDNPYFIHDLVSESKEILQFQTKTAGQIIYTSGKRYHALQSYVGGTVMLQYTDAQGLHTMFAKIIQTDENSGAILLDKLIPISQGAILLQNGKNTIWDRLMHLQSQIATNPAYSNLLDSKGDISNRMLQMLISGKVVDYTNGVIIGELPDTYDNMRFVKFFNFVEDGGNTANYIIDGWEELLQYTNENKEIENEIRNFARDLIVYGFITSGDKSGFTKVFKYAPASWREESGYGEFVYSKLVEYAMGLSTDIDLNDVILNNWHDNEFVPTYKLVDPKTKAPNFVKYSSIINGVTVGYPTILAALKTGEDGKYVPSIAPGNAPMFIKIKRRKDKNSYDSQRRFTVYKLHGLASTIDGFVYPVYLKVNPKGISVSDGFLITEYGRSDSVLLQEYAIDEVKFKNFYTAADLGNKLQGLIKTYPEYSAIVSGLARYYHENEEGLPDLSSVTAPTVPEVPVSSSIAAAETKMNIYAGTGENADLSNFAVRPFEINDIKFESVEQGFQYAKFDVLKQVINSGYTERDVAYNDVIQKINKIQQQLLNTKRSSFNTDKDFGAKLKSIGGTRLTANDSDLQMIINNFFAKEKVDGFTNWEKGSTASKVMKVLIKASFQAPQNSQILQRLLATGNATLTHTQDGGKWGTEFPKLLMEVREELRGSNTGETLTNESSNTKEHEQC